MAHSKQVFRAGGLDRSLLFADLAGTLVFAIEGAMAAVDANLDLIGIMVLASCTAFGGGIVRDILLGALPPAALRDWRYPTLGISAAALAFFLHRSVHAVPGAVIQVLDAAGLGLFAVAGTIKAKLHKMNTLVALVLGTITAVGGGTIRDILLGRIPGVFRFEIYATAALAGSAIMIGLRRMRVPSNLAAVIGALACFLLRIVSVWQHWNLPRALGQ